LVKAGSFACFEGRAFRLPSLGVCVSNQNQNQKQTLQICCHRYTLALAAAKVCTHSHLFFTLTYPNFLSLLHSFIRRIFFFFFSLSLPVSYFSFSLTDNVHCYCRLFFFFFSFPFSYPLSMSGYSTTVTNAMALVFEVYRRYIYCHIVSLFILLSCCC